MRQSGNSMIIKELDVLTFCKQSVLLTGYPILPRKTNKLYLNNGLMQMADKTLLALRVPEKLLQQLNFKYPDIRMRNNVIKALIQKCLNGKIVVHSYEYEIKSQ